MNYLRKYLKCPDCKKPWGKYGTMCDDFNCDYERPFLVWLFTAAWPFGLVLLFLIGLFVGGLYNL